MDKKRGVKFMLRLLAILIGIVFISLGIMGFIPELSPDGKLLNLFKVNFEHNIVHLLTGLVAFLCGLSSGFASKMFFIIGGVVYGFLGVYGLWVGNDMLFDMIANNQADNFLHIGLGLLMASIGFGMRY